MYRWPKLFITLYLLSSMALAFVVHKYVQQNGVGIELSSRAPDAVAAVEFEDPEKCTDENNYYEKRFDEIERVDVHSLNNYSVFRQKYEEGDEVTRRCILFAMKNWTGNTITCSKQESKKIKYNLTDVPSPCVTERYVNIVYNTYVDMMKCAGESDWQRDFLPVFYHESGFHINAYSDGKAIGLMQMRNQNVEESNKFFAEEKKAILDKAKTNLACGRLAPLVSQLQPITAANDVSNPEAQKRCDLISTPKNPALSMLYALITLKANKNVIESLLAKPDAVASLKKAGYNMKDPIFYQSLVRVLNLLAVNAGPTGAVKAFIYFIDRNFDYTHKKLPPQLLDFYTSYKDPNLPDVKTFKDVMEVAQTSGNIGYFSDLLRRYKSLKDYQEQYNENCVSDEFLKIYYSVKKK